MKSPLGYAESVLIANENPLDVMRTMARFGADEGQGIAEIVDALPARVMHRVGLACLCREPEKRAIPVFDCMSRQITMAMLADWLHDRGYEASACRWEHQKDEHIRWRLVIGTPLLPALPPLPVDLSVIANFGFVGGGGGSFTTYRYVPPPSEKDKTNA